MARGYGLYPGSGAADELLYASALSPIAKAPQQLYENILSGRKLALLEEEGRRREAQRRFDREQVDKADFLAAQVGETPATPRAVAPSSAGRQRKRPAPTGDTPKSYIDAVTGATKVSGVGGPGPGQFDRFKQAWEASYDPNKIIEEQYGLEQARRKLAASDAERKAIEQQEGEGRPLSEKQLWEARRLAAARKKDEVWIQDLLEDIREGLSLDKEDREFLERSGYDVDREYSKAEAARLEARKATSPAGVVGAAVAPAAVREAEKEAKKEKRYYEAMAKTHGWKYGTKLSRSKLTEMKDEGPPDKYSDAKKYNAHLDSVATKAAAPADIIEEITPGKAPPESKVPKGKVPEDKVPEDKVPEEVVQRLLGMGVSEERARKFKRPSGAYLFEATAPGPPSDIELLDDAYLEFFPEGGGPGADVRKAALMEISETHSNQFPGLKIGSKAFKRSVRIAAMAEELLRRGESARAEEYARLAPLVLQQEAKYKREYIENLAPILVSTYGYKPDRAKGLATLWYDNPEQAEAITGDRATGMAAYAKSAGVRMGHEDRREYAEKIEDATKEKSDLKSRSTFAGHGQANLTALQNEIGSLEGKQTTTRRTLDTQIGALENDSGVNPDGRTGDDFVRNALDDHARQGDRPTDSEGARVWDAREGLRIANNNHKEASGALMIVKVDEALLNQELRDIDRGVDPTNKTYTVTVDVPGGPSKTIIAPSFASGKREAHGFPEPKAGGTEIGISRDMAAFYEDLKDNAAEAAVAGGYAGLNKYPPIEPKPRKPLDEPFTPGEINYAVDLDAAVRAKEGQPLPTEKDEAERQKEEMREAWGRKTPAQQARDFKTLRGLQQRYRIAITPSRPKERRGGGGGALGRAPTGRGGIPDEMKVPQTSTMFANPQWYEVAYQAGYRPDDPSNPEGMWVDHIGDGEPATAEEAKKVFGRARVRED